MLKKKAAETSQKGIVTMVTSRLTLMRVLMVIVIMRTITMITTFILLLIRKRRSIL